MDTLPGAFLAFAVGMIFEPAAKPPTLAWIDTLKTAVEPWRTGVYLSFSDDDEDIADAFPPATVERLRAAKEAYDPENVFHANHPVGNG